MKVIVGGVFLCILIGGVIFFFQSANVNTQKKKVDSVNDAATVVSQASESVKSTISVESPQNKMKQYKTPPVTSINENKTYVATIQTNKGSMNVTLYAKEVPNTVNNFVFLAREGFYADTPFHRIIKGFMVQGGDPTGTGRGGPGYQFADESITRSYKRGTMAMANAGPNTNGSQFFIVHEDTDLPKNYVIFGTIESTDTRSLATLDAIATTPVTQSDMGERSKPTESVFVKSIFIEEK